MSTTTTDSNEQEAPDPPISVMFHHAKRLYDAMLAESRMQVVEDDRMVVWEGAFTKLIADLNYSVPYHSKLKDHLVRMGCIQQLRRGGGSAPSVWWLKREPTEELFNHAAQLRKPGNAMAQQLKDLNNRVYELERTVRALSAGKAGSNG